jgi:hypothetical protein
MVNPGNLPVLSSRSVPRYEFAIETPGIIRPIEANGELFIEAVRSGRTRLVVRTLTSERRITIDVTDPAQPPIVAGSRTVRSKERPPASRLLGEQGLPGLVHGRSTRHVLPSEKRSDDPPRQAADIWGPGDKRPYPAPSVLLTTFFARRATDSAAYNDVVAPFLDRLTMGVPVGGYPPDFPVPRMSELLKEWTIVVRFGRRFERAYRRGDSNKTLLIEFEGV